MKPGVNLSEWSSVEAEQRFRQMEDELAADELAERPESIVVPTRLGPTHVYRWPGSGEPIVFLHGATGTGLTWGRYVEARGLRAAYAIDTIGDVGRSRQEVPVESADDLAEWLDQTLEGVGVDGAHFVGTSYGGFLALNQAVRRPGRARSLFLIDPAGLVEVRLVRFLLWGVSAMVASLMPRPVRKIAARVLRFPAVEDRRMIKVGFFAQRHHKTRQLRPPLFTDEELRSVGVPAQVVVAAKSEVFPSAVSRVRAALLPSARVEVVPDAGHAVVDSHAERLMAELGAFLDGVTAEPPTRP